MFHFMFNHNPFHRGHLKVYIVLCKEEEPAATTDVSQQLMNHKSAYLSAEWENQMKEEQASSRH